MTDCIEHTQKGNGKGYGHTNRNGANVHLHRLAYVEDNGLTLEDIKGKVVRHRCDNPRCINPKHLEIGTYVDNYQDMVSRGRHVYKLTNSQVAEIRSLYATGEIKQIRLAERYGVTPTQICYIVNNKQRKE